MSKKTVLRNLVILATVLVFILVLVLVLQFIMIGVELSKSSALQAEYDSLNQDINAVKEDVEYRSSLLYIEKYAREQLGLYGEGDIVFVPQG